MINSKITKKWKTISAAVLMVLFFLPLSPFAAEGPALIAVGDGGFQVTQDDSATLKAVAQESMFSSTDEQSAIAAVKLELFAREAEAMGLDRVEDGEVETPQTDKEWVQYKLWLKNKYLLHLKESSVMDDRVIVSYYWANPKRFRDWEAYKESEGKMVEPPLVPLNDEVKKQVNEYLVDKKMPAIVQEAYEALVDKYNVKFVGKE